ncbi:reverse transcriptase domain-containing protein [Tanacetum coccineum]|uniref:Reverse transcriptase domain-containing protein n=1 Tax=Tanacetum coccineum TaxID=301880 RepID=A0ABQ4XJX0_9ASTR
MPHAANEAGATNEVPKRVAGVEPGPNIGANDKDGNGIHNVGSDAGTKPDIPNEKTSSFAGAVNSTHVVKKVNFRSLVNTEKVENYDMVLPRSAIDKVKNRFENSLVGYFVGKSLAFPIVQNYVNNTWGKFGLQKLTRNESGPLGIKAGLGLSAKVNEIIVSGMWKWPAEWTSKYLMLANLAIPNLSNAPDGLLWRHISNDESNFSVAKAWECIRPRANDVDWFHVVWFSHQIRHAIHLWLVMRRKLKTQDMLRQWDDAGFNENETSKSLKRMPKIDIIHYRKIVGRWSTSMGIPSICFWNAYKGYHQIKMQKRMRENGVITSKGYFAILRWTFGLKTVGSTSHRLRIRHSKADWNVNLELNMNEPKKFTSECRKECFRLQKEHEELIIYLAAAKEAISAILMTDREGRQIPVYFVSRTLRGPEVNYYSYEMLVVSLASARKLLKILPSTHDFIVERPEEESPDELMAEPEVLPEPWTLFTDGSSAVDGSGEDEYTKSEGGRFYMCLEVLVEELKEKSINEKEILGVVEEEGNTWMTPILIRTGYYWPTMHMDARNLIRECNDCQIHRPVPRNPQQNLTPISSPWPILYSGGEDIAGPFTEGPRTSRPSPAIKLRSALWDNLFGRFGLTGEILLKWKACFRDNPFKDWCEKLCIRQCFASVKPPQANGLVERANRSLGEGIKARLDEKSKDWIEELPHVL